MAVIITGNTAHDATLRKAEHDRQVAYSQPGLTQAQAHAIDVAYAQTALASSIGMNNSANVALFKTMLRELGVN